MSSISLLKLIEALPFAAAVRESTWMFPTIETVHVIALVLVVGTISVVDLRLLGLAGKDQPVGDLTARLLPGTWCAFGLAMLTGLLMFCSNAVSYGHNLAFLIKMGLLALAGLNMAAFHIGAHRTVSAWGAAVETPIAARIAGGASLALWIGVVFAGRWIGFIA